LPGDLAVTADIPLAAILVEKGLIVLDPPPFTRRKDAVEAAATGTR